MKLLALDTATEACSVALLMDGGLVSRFKEVGRGHAEQILGMVDAVLAEAGVGLGTLDGIAASIGPGAFTGVRISVSVAQGLAFGAGLPVVGVTTLEALALQALRGGAELAQTMRGGADQERILRGRADGEQTLRGGADVERTLRGGAELGVGSGIAQAMACLDARMGEVYWGCFAADAARGVIARSPMAVSAAAVGSGAARQAVCRHRAGFRGVSLASRAARGVGCVPEPATRCPTPATWHGWARSGWPRARAWTRPASPRSMCAIRSR